MILTFCGQNYTLLQVTNATPEEMNVIKAAVTETVDRFRRRNNKQWDGSISMCWYIDGYFYIPAACWKRVYDLQYPDPQRYRPAYQVEFRNQDKFFNKTVTREDVESFVQSLNPAFDDIDDQITVLWYIIMYRMSSHNIATGFGKTYLSYLLAQWTSKVNEGKTVMIVPRVALVEQGISDFNKFMQTIDDIDKIKCYGICGGFRNTCNFDEADVYICTYQSMCDMPEDMFAKVSTVICDEGHTAKALSVAECIRKCKNAQIVTAISGTMRYVQDADALTVEQFCGPMVTDYSAHMQIEKGRLPKIAIQPICIRHTDGKALYMQMLEQQRLPYPTSDYTAELAATYRSLEFQYLWSNEHLMNYILLLCKTITDQNRNVLVIFANRQPAINVFELANERGQKAHLILGGTPPDVRLGIKGQLEREGGWILSATAGTMAMGISINNLHGIIFCMLGHSPHVVLQSVGRMLRNHPDKFNVTVCYDVYNDFSSIGTHFDVSNHQARMHYYNTEQHPVYETAFRTDIDY